MSTRNGKVDTLFSEIDNTENSILFGTNYKIPVPQSFIEFYQIKFKIFPELVTERQKVYSTSAIL